jgi:hypothetical protein
MAHLLLGLDNFKSGAYVKAKKEFTAASEGPIGELTSTLARAWTEVAQGRTKTALKLLNMPNQAEWAQFYLNYHRALIADVGGRRKQASAALRRSYQQDNVESKPALPLGAATNRTIARLESRWHMPATLLITVA